MEEINSNRVWKKEGDVSVAYVRKFNPELADAKNGNLVRGHTYIIPWKNGSMLRFKQDPQLKHLGLAHSKKLFCYFPDGDFGREKLLFTIHEQSFVAGGYIMNVSSPIAVENTGATVPSSTISSILYDWELEAGASEMDEFARESLFSFLTAARSSENLFREN